MKRVLEPIFEADLEPLSYGFRTERRTDDAVAEIRLFGTTGYRWVLDADTKACFDSTIASIVNEEGSRFSLSASDRSGALSGPRRDRPVGGPAVVHVLALNPERWLECLNVPPVGASE